MIQTHPNYILNVFGGQWLPNTFWHEGRGNGYKFVEGPQFYRIPHPSRFCFTNSIPGQASVAPLFLSPSKDAEEVPTMKGWIKKSLLYEAFKRFFLLILSCDFHLWIGISLFTPVCFGPCHTMEPSVGSQIWAFWRKAKYSVLWRSIEYIFWIIIQVWKKKKIKDLKMGVIWDL